jgi:hypothetical protein
MTQSRISKSTFALQGQFAESELPGLTGWRTERALRFFGTDPSPGPLRLMKAPAADHPLPKGEG